MDFFIYISSFIFKENQVLHFRKNCYSRVKELDSIDRNDIENLEDLLRLVSIMKNVAILK